MQPNTSQERHPGGKDMPANHRETKVHFLNPLSHVKMARYTSYLIYAFYLCLLGEHTFQHLAFSGKVGSELGNFKLGDMGALKLTSSLQLLP